MVENPPSVRLDPPDRLRAETPEKMVAVTDWDGQIEGGLAIGDESLEEWLKFEGEVCNVLECK